MPSHTGLKALVIGLGVLIFIGLSVLIGTITWRVSAITDARDTVGEFDFTLPNGAEIQNSSVNGDQLLVHLVFPSDAGRQELWVINHRTGRIVSKLSMAGTP